MSQVESRSGHFPSHIPIVSHLFSDEHEVSVQHQNSSVEEIFGNTLVCHQGPARDVKNMYLYLHFATAMFLYIPRASPEHIFVQTTLVCTIFYPFPSGKEAVEMETHSSSRGSAWMWMSKASRQPHLILSQIRTQPLFFLPSSP